MSSNRVQELLEERGAQYGSFEENSDIAIAATKAFSMNGALSVSNTEKLAATMVGVKIGRAVSSPAYKDSWEDMRGYIELSGWNDGNSKHLAISYARILKQLVTSNQTTVNPKALARVVDAVARLALDCIEQ